MDQSELGLPYGVFWFGVGMLMIGVIGTCWGKIWGRNGQKIDRRKSPNAFWIGVSSYFLSGLGLICYYLYKAGVFSK